MPPVQFFGMKQRAQEGLTVRVEASCGGNLADWDEKENPEGMKEIK